jgi:short-subunit dehydrogenase
VNIGSTFGSLPFPGFAAYSAAKAGLRGFSQALRRELADSLVSVDPHRAARHRYAAEQRRRQGLNRALKNHSDSAEDVARQIVAPCVVATARVISAFPERLFAWLNGVAPALIDRGLAGKLAIIKQHSFSPSS